MLTGIAFILLALLLAGAIVYHLMIDRTRDIAHLDRRIAVLATPAAAVARRHGPLPVPEMIAPVLARAQIELTTRTLTILLAILSVIFLIALLIGGTAAALVMAVAPAAAVAAWINARAHRRIEALIDALPFYIDAVRQLIGVGNSLSQALLSALPASPKAVQSYMAGAARRIELGAPVAESMQQVADRLRIPEVAMLAAAIRVNIRFGGSMTTVLSNLGQIVRERLRIKRELRSATSEIKVSTWVLIGMPVVAVVLLFTINPDYIHFFIGDPRGHRLAIIAVVLQGLGIFAMSRMMRISF